MLLANFVAILGAALQMLLLPLSLQEPWTPGASDNGSTARWTCQAPKWHSPPSIRSGAFVGELTSDCQVTHTSGNGLAGVSAYLLSIATYRATVHSGPNPGLYERLPAVHYDLTETHGKTDPVAIRHDLHIASDARTKLIWASLSKSIKGSGFAGYLKKTDIVLTVWPEGSAGDYIVRLYTRIIVEKPWYAPGGIFRSKVEELAREKYLESRAKLVPNLATRL